MSKKSPIFPIPEPHQHFSDYGFDPQIDYFQVLEEARDFKKETLTSIETLHLKLQKPVSKDDHYSHSHKKIKRNRMRWWRNAFLIFRRNKSAPTASSGGNNINHHEEERHHVARSISGPVYITESRSGPSTLYRTTRSRPFSGPLAGTLSKDESQTQIPYLSLRELNMDHHHRISTTATPIYVVT